MESEIYATDVIPWLFAVFCLAVITGLLGMWVSNQKGRRQGEGFLLGFLLSFIGVFIELLLPTIQPSRQSADSSSP